MKGKVHTWSFPHESYGPYNFLTQVYMHALCTNCQTLSRLLEISQFTSATYIDKIVADFFFWKLTHTEQKLIKLVQAKALWFLFAVREFCSETWDWYGSVCVCVACVRVCVCLCVSVCVWRGGGGGKGRGEGRGNVACGINWFFYLKPARLTIFGFSVTTPKTFLKNLGWSGVP